MRWCFSLTKPRAETRYRGGRPCKSRAQGLRSVETAKVFPPRDVETLHVAEPMMLAVNRPQREVDVGQPAAIAYDAGVWEKQLVAGD